MSHHGIELQALDSLSGLDAVVLAVPHRSYLANPKLIAPLLKSGGLVVDIKSVLHFGNLPKDARYWGL